MQNNCNPASEPGQEPKSGDGYLGTEGKTPEYLIPTMGEVPLNEPAYYRSLFILDTIDSAREKLEELTGGIDPFDSKFDDDTDSCKRLKPAFGVLTVHEQVWVQKGLGLGNLLQSVCLAPGEVTQVAVTRWERKTTGTSSESAEQGESVSSQIEQNRAVNEVQRAVAKEAQSGNSSAFASSASAQVGASWLFGSASASSTTSVALTAQYSAGSRDVAAESTNAIAQSTAEKSQALRSRRQSVVREVTEQEAESMSTRVLANYNRRHTLNILFFEVLQTYEFKTILKYWDRCLFIPLVPLNFEDQQVIKDHQAQLLSVFADLGAKDMIEHLNRALAGEKDGSIAAVQEQYDTQIRDLQKAKQLAKEYAQARVPHQWTKRVPSDYQLNGPIVYEDKIVEEPEPQKMQEKAQEYSDLKKKYELLPPIEMAIDVIEGLIHDLTVKKAETNIPIGKIFNKQRLFLSQQLWLRMSPYHVYRILQKYKIKCAAADGATSKEQALSALVAPEPVGVFGNYLAFRWTFEGDEPGRAEREKFEKTYIKPQPEGETKMVGLPTSGIFAEAVLGKSIAAEKNDADYPKWGGDDSKIPILPPKIADLQSRDRAKGMDLKSQDFASSLAQLRAEKLADVSHIDKILAQAGNGAMFRDMGGLAQAVTLADKLAALSASSADKANENAVKLQSKVLDTFKDVIESDVGKAAVAEFMLPGSGTVLLGAKEGKSKAKSEEKGTSSPK